MTGLRLWHLWGMSFLAALALLPGAVAAQTVTVRSGDHETFARLTMTLPAGTDWSTEPTDDGFRIRFSDTVSQFNLVAAFERIQRDRISAITEVAEELALDLTTVCDCRLEAALFEPDLLVIDIIDSSGTAGESVAGIQSLDLPASAVPAPAQTAIVDSPPPDSARPQITRTPVQLPLLTDRARAGLGIALPTTIRDAPQRSTALAETERAILESFARAATQGVFDFPATLAPGTPEANSQDSQIPVSPGLAPITDPMDGVALPDSRDGPRPGMILRTGIARGDDTIFEADDTPDAEAIACERLGNLDVSDWIGEGDFSTLIGEGRIALTTETGRLVAPAALDLARRYIAFGFGLEARDVLRLLSGGDYANNRDDATTLATLATLVDGDPAPNDPIARTFNCGPEAAIWTTLARGTLDGTDDHHRDATMIGFRDLPDSLRGHLGIQLAGMFSAAGEHLIANQILDAARTHVTGGGMEADIAAAEIAGAQHGPEAEIARLDALTEHNPRVEPDTVTRLLDLTSAAGQEANPHVFDMAEGLRFEVEGTADEVTLAEAEVRALIVGNEFGRAIDLIAATREQLGETSAASYIDDVFGAMTERAGDDEFLERALTIGAGGISAAHQNAAAARLLNLGFPDLALTFVAGAAGQDDMRERRYLRAAAAADLGDVVEVDVALEGMRDDRAQAIRAAARTVAGDFSGGFDGPATSDIESAWRAGDWADLEASDDALLSSASRAALTEVTAPETDTTLAARQTLLDEAESTRAMTEALLERFVVDDGS